MKTSARDSSAAQAVTPGEAAPSVERYFTVRGTVETEIEISRSRFLTRLERVSSEDEAREVIASVRQTHPKARHHCTAFVLGADEHVQRSNDDGEPSGTAGAPMLDALNSAHLSDVVAVVTRYFGGVLLGAAGLTRAYRRAVAEATQRAQRQERRLLTPVTLTLAYEAAAPLEAEARRRGYVVSDAEYTEQVRQTYLLAAREIDAFTQLAAEHSAGASKPSVGSPRFIDL